MKIETHPLTGTGNVLDAFYKRVRRSEGFRSKVYPDKDGVPTLGNGYALLINTGNNGWKRRDDLDADLGSIGVSVTANEKRLLDDISRQLSSGNEAGAKALLNSAMANNSAFDFTITQADARTLYDQIIQDYHDAVNNFLGGLHKNWQGTKEKLALLDMEYNGYLATQAKSPSLYNAIHSGNRAEAWYEIRYNTNGDHDDGIANRRYRESDLFGLYDNKANITEAEASNVIRMFTKYWDEISVYEGKFSPTTSSAASQSILDSISRAESVLIGEYVTDASVPIRIKPGEGHVLLGSDTGDTLAPVQVQNKTSHNEFKNRLTNNVMTTTAPTT